MRECKGKYWDGTRYVEFESGLFHQWGMDYKEFESGPANYTIAIVELPDGKVVTSAPTYIQFVNSKKG